MATSALSILPPGVTADGAWYDTQIVAPGTRNVVSYVVPSGYYADLVFCRASFSTDATAGDRSVRVEYHLPVSQLGEDALSVTSPFLQGPGLAVDYSFSQETGSTNTAGVNWQNVQLPSLFWQPGSQFQLWGITLGGSDTWMPQSVFQVLLFPYTQTDVQAEKPTSTPILV